MNFPECVYREVGNHLYPLVFATVTGSHQYGFPSDDSDYDLRGAHVVPIEEVIGLRGMREVVDTAHVVDGIELDMVTFDLTKFVKLILAGNGNVLEQVFSPHTLMQEPPYFDELKQLARMSLSRCSAAHYIGFADQQLRLFDKSQKVKQLLYVFRALLTGLYLMEYGDVTANAVELAKFYHIACVCDLVDLKLRGREHMSVHLSNTNPVYNEVLQLRARLAAARDVSRLPTDRDPKVDDWANDYVVRVRRNLTWRIGN